MKKKYLSSFISCLFLFLLCFNLVLAENVDVILDSNDAASSFQIKNLDKTTVASIDATGNITAIGTVDAQKGVKYPDGNTQIEAYLGTNNLPNNSGWIKSTGRVTLEASGDKVGIGTDAPSKKLDVVGSMNITLKTISAPSDTFSIENIDSSNNRLSVLKYDSFINDLLIDKDGVLGSVGIGLTAPSSKLTVNGTIETKGIGGIKFPDESIQTTASGWTKKGNAVLLQTATDKVGIGTTIPTSKLSVKLTYQDGASDGAAEIGYSATASNFNAIAMGHTVNAKASKSMVIGTGYDTGDDFYYLENNIPNSLMIGFNSTAPTLFISSNESTGISSGIGKIGIGTTKPEATLDVNGDFYARGNAAIGSHVEIPTFFVSSSEGKGTTGNVGIGTASPLAKLHVTSESSSVAPVQISTTDNPYALYIRSDGIIGIGTNSPSLGFERDKLTVTGTIHATSGGIRFPDNTIQETAYTGSSTGGDGTLPAGTTNQTLRYSGAGWIANSLLLNTGSYIGIGNGAITPSNSDYKLIVKGTIEAQDGIAFPDKKTQTRAYLGESDSGWIRDPINKAITTEAGGDQVIIGGLTGRTIPKAKLVVFSESTEGAATIGHYTNKATGVFSVAIGEGTVAEGEASFASGFGSQAKKGFTTALGYRATAEGAYSTAIGYRAIASGEYSTAIGMNVKTNTSKDFSIVLGSGVTPAAEPLVNNEPNSLAIGFKSNIPTLFVGASSGINTTGNVGIGTTSVFLENSSKLTVLGTIETKGTGGIKFPDGSTLITANGIGNGTVTSVNSGKGLRGGPITSTGALTVEVDDSTIGFNSNSSLEVKNSGISNDKIVDGTITNAKVKTGNFVKQISAGKNILISGDEGAGAGTGIVTITAEAPSTGWIKSAGQVTLETTSDKVGIGTDAPQAKLSVVTQSGGAATFGKDNTASGSFSVAIGTGSSATNTAAVAIGNYTLAEGQFSLAVGNLSNAQGNNSLAIGDNVKTKDNKTSGNNGHAAMALGSSFSNAVNNSLGIGFGDLDILLNPDGNSYFNANSEINSNNVGIGTTEPTSKLTVAGTIEITDNGGLKFLNGIQTEAYFGQNTGWEKIGGNVNLKTTTDKVGIGTTSPKAKLHITNGTLLVEGNQDEAFDFTDTDVTFDRAFFWLPSKAALRAGTSTDGSWAYNEIKDYSVAIGNNPIVDGVSAFALGESAVASNDYAVAIGKSAQALGVESIAIGSGAIANATASYGTGGGSISIGYDSQALGSTSIAMGKNTIAKGEGSVAMGISTTAEGRVSFAIGEESQAKKDSSFAMGQQVISDANGATILGQYAINTHQYSIGIGYSKTILEMKTEPQVLLSANDNSWIGGYGGNLFIGTTEGEATLEVEGSVLFTGTGTNKKTRKLSWDPSTGSLSVGEVTGNQWDSRGDYSFSAGQNNSATKKGSVAMGINTTANGLGSVAMGSGSNATQNYAFASGSNANANGFGSIAIGENTTAEQNSSVAIGSSNIAGGTDSFVFGHNSSALGPNSIVVGVGSSTTANNSLAIGTQAKANSIESIAIGNSLAVYGNNAIAIGNDLTTSSDNAIIIGSGTTNNEPFTNNIPNSLMVGFFGGVLPPLASPAPILFVSGEANYGGVGIGTTAIGANKLYVKGNVWIEGSLSKTSGNFDIKHPNPEKEGWRLRHSFVESPTRGENIYRWTVKVEKGEATIDLPDYFKYLNENVQVWVSPKDNFGRAYGNVDNELNTLSVKADLDGEYNVLAIGTRKDKDAKEFDALGVEYKE
ncbi:hypothetical protein A3J90_07725 [candidate division WOR-1 bacterium RIFOXYC2_FULL_37_10]|nr:MAG: hypothetical protein A3J90_07725 [candidate division WOR-1 bacterium RIFOXYC2_FULL_37_10]